jgi:hypothetical protein
VWRADFADHHKIERRVQGLRNHDGDRHAAARQRINRRPVQRHGCKPGRELLSRLGPVRERHATALLKQK